MSVFDEAWDFRLDLMESESKMLCDFKANVCHLSKQISNQLEEFQVQNFNYSGNACRNSDDELKIITERNKQLVHEIKTKVEEYERQQIQYGKFKSDQKLLAKEIKDTHEAFLMAKKYYKKYLKIYFTVEARKDGKQQIFLQFFTEVKKESKEYSVQLLKDTNTKRYEDKPKPGYF
ncbi:uncharacterized protein isoform X2 [Choristoneura fumiferana]|uniref:uncharacterized protein isoform X2 n=1 Tax=Choristoneura fumiferana TaxID=7141 RepID=UPI003D15CF55